MTNKKEIEIEDFLYENPWLIDPSYEIARIKGEKVHGRQVNVGNEVTGGRYVDLLLKDTLSGRPVIVELKKDEIQRKDIGQTLEYRALFLVLPDNIREQFNNEFGKNYIVPKLVVIGENCTEEIRLSANLAGIEVKELKRKIKKSIDIEKVVKEFRDYREFIEQKSMSFRGKISKIEKWFDILQETCKEVEGELEAYGFESISGENFWTGTDLPFMDFGVRTTGKFKKYICGFYEFYLYTEDETYDLPYDSDFFYGEIWFADFKEEIIENKEAEKYVRDGLRHKEIKEVRIDQEGKSFITDIPRHYLEDNKELKSIFKKYIELSLELRKIYGNV